MKNCLKLDKALEIAMTVHSGQTDKAGTKSYIEHSIAVMTSLGSDASINEKIVAILHDIIEDCDEDDGYSLCKEMDENFGISVTESVIALTHCEGMPYHEYIDQVSRNPVATKIKIHDIKHNTSIDRYKNLNGENLEKFLNKIKEKYIPAMIFLTNKIEEWKRI